MTAADPITVAYVVTRFPKLTETFVVQEMDAVERAGATVRLHPLRHEHAPVAHPAARRWERRAEFTAPISPAVLASNAWYLLHRPRRYARAVLAAVVGTWGSARLFVAAVLVLPEAVHLARRFERTDVAHVHCHFATHPALVGHVVHLLTGIPYSFTAHGSDLHRDRHMLPQKVAGAAFVVAISDHNAEVIRNECGDAGRVVVLRCGVDVSRLTPTSGELQERPFVITCVGTLHEVKGQEHLLDACARLVRSGLDLQCHLVGDGPDRRSLRGAVDRLGLADRVTFHGAQPAAAVQHRLHRSHVLVAPSVPTADGRREGVPVVLMEAMACGLPVVASRLSGIPEVVHDGVEGLLVEPRDAAGLATALGRLAEQPALRHEMGRAGRARVERDHAADVQARRLVDCFERVGR